MPCESTRSSSIISGAGLTASVRWRDDMRQVQQYLNPEAEYWLDWFHITMRITVVKQRARGLAKETKPSGGIDSEPAARLEGKSIEKELQSLKWNLWHGNVERALEHIEDLQWDLELTAGAAAGNRTKLLKQLGEFNGYIQNNREFIPNYGGAVPEWGANLDRVCGIDGKPSGKQANGEK